MTEEQVREIALAAAERDRPKWHSPALNGVKADKIARDLTEAIRILTEADIVCINRHDLRTYVINEHERPAYGEFLPNGGNCRMCRSEWGEQEPEAHKPGCIAVLQTGDRK